MTERTSTEPGTGPNSGSGTKEPAGKIRDSVDPARPASSPDDATTDDHRTAWSGSAWTRRAVAGGLLAAVAGGAVFALRPGALPRTRDGGTVPLAPPQPEPAEALPDALPDALPAEPLPDEMARVVPEASVAGQPAPQPPAVAEQPDGRPQIAIVIDDLGLKQAETRRAIALPGPLTLAFLPYGEALSSHTHGARARGHEVIVHLPMDPGARANPGPQALRLGLDPAEMERRLAWNLAQVPGHAGVNNHMGSALTENAAAMSLVLERLKQDGGYFLDSRTTARSAAREIAARIGLPYAERDVFLDNDLAATAIERQLAETETLARRYGTAIAIGHPHAQTLSVLETWLQQADAKGFDVVPVSTIIATRGSPLWRLARDRKGRAGS